MKTLSTATPHLIILVGLPGSGKTHFGEQFSRTFNAPYINARTFSNTIHDASVLRSIARHFLLETLKSQKTTLYECVSGTRAERADIIKAARAKGYVPLLVWPQVGPDIAAARTIKQGVFSQEQVANLSKQFSAPHATEKAIVISGMHTFPSQAKTVLRRLATSNRSGQAKPASRSTITVQ